MLQEFREQHLIWDKANRRIHESVKANASDANGRKLTVQVLNDGVVEDLAGASLSLFWKTRNEKNKGLDAFDVVDASQGIFELYYTTGMLSNEGKLRANLVLVDDLGRIVSDAFVIEVSPGIDENAAASSDSFTALTKALVDIQNLEENYAPRLNEVAAQLAQTVTKEEFVPVRKGVSSSPPITVTQSMEVGTTATRLTALESGRYFIIVRPTDIDISIGEGWGTDTTDNGVVYEPLTIGTEVFISGENPIWAKASTPTIVSIYKVVRV